MFIQNAVIIQDYIFTNSNLNACVYLAQANPEILQITNFTLIKLLTSRKTSLFDDLFYLEIIRNVVSIKNYFDTFQCTFCFICN